MNTAPESDAVAGVLLEKSVSGAHGVEHDAAFGEGIEVGLRALGVVETEVVGENADETSARVSEHVGAVVAQGMTVLGFSRRRALVSDARSTRAEHVQGTRLGGGVDGHEQLRENFGRRAVQTGREVAEPVGFDGKLQGRHRSGGEQGCGEAANLVGFDHTERRDLDEAAGCGRLGKGGLGG